MNNGISSALLSTCWNGTTMPGNMTDQEVELIMRSISTNPAEMNSSTTEAPFGNTTQPASEDLFEGSIMQVELSGNTTKGVSEGGGTTQQPGNSVTVGKITVLDDQIWGRLVQDKFPLNPIKCLIREGVDKDAQNKEGCTMSHGVTQYNNTEAFKYLLEDEKADMNLKCNITDNKH